MLALLLCLLFSLPLFSQVTAQKQTNTVVTAVAGTITCTFTSALPIPTVGVTTKCVDSITTQTSGGVPPVGSTSSGINGSFASAGNIVTWLFTLPTAAGPISYSVAATPSGGTTSSGNGTF